MRVLLAVRLLRLHKRLAAGFDLFDRVGKRLQLNSQGQLTYKFAKSIFNMGNELLLSVKNQQQNQQQVFCVGVT